MSKTAKIGLLIALGLLISISAAASGSKNFAMINTGSRTRKSIVKGGVTYFTNYSLLPIVENQWTEISVKDTIRAIKSLNLPEIQAKALFALILSEAARNRKTGNFRGLNNNYAGVQTDSGVWGFANFIGQTPRIDSGGDPRMFAVFTDFQAFIEFLNNRAQSKGIASAANASAWADAYIRKWWGRTPTATTLKAKGNIYNTAVKLWEKN